LELSSIVRVSGSGGDQARRLVLAGASGALLALSFPKFGAAPVAFVALAPLLLALRGASPRMGFLAGHVTGFVAALGILYWTSTVVAQFGGASPVVAGVSVLALAAAFGLFPAVFGLAQARLIAAFGPAAILAAPVPWVATEFLREHLLFGFAWCLLGYSQVDFVELIQISSVTAVHGVSFVVASVSAAAAHAMVEPDAGRRRRGLTWTAALLAGALTFGHVTLRGAWSAGMGFPVAVIQASIPQDQKWDPDLLLANIEQHLALSRAAAADRARLIVWPESAVGPAIDDHPEIRERLARLATDAGVFLLFGNDDHVRTAGGVRSYVGAKLIEPGGGLALRYRKMRLVPFGEYMPRLPLVGSVGPFERLVESVSDFSPGDEPAVGDVMGARVGAFICYEAIFPSLVRRFTANGAQVLVNVTNDGWYGTSSAPYQHFAMARFRAVENRRFLIRAANTGISAIVDPFGRVVARTELFETRHLAGEISAISDETFYSRHGDVFAWTVVGLAAVLAGAAERRLRSAR
jgi:apolipoprotein N-acyltransferase